MVLIMSLLISDVRAMPAEQADETDGGNTNLADDSPADAPCDPGSKDHPWNKCSSGFKMWMQEKTSKTF